MFEIILFLTFAVLSGVQPLLVKWFMPTTVKRNVIILCQELVKLIISLLVLLITSDYCIDLPDWTFKSAIVAAGVPSIMFVIQNHCNLFSNQILQPVTFVVLNQTKIVWTALWCFLLLKQSQSKIQIISLLLVIVATLYLRKILPLCCCCSTTSPTTRTSTSRTPTSNSSSTTDSNENIGIGEIERNKDGDDCELQLEQLNVPLLTSRPSSQSPTNNSISKNNTITRTTTVNNNNDVEEDNNNNDNNDDDDNEIYEAKPKNTINNSERLLSLGVTLALFASFLSGLSGSITQLTLQVNDRNPHLFNIELSIVSIVLLIISTMGTSIFGGGSGSGGSGSSSSASSASSSISSKSPRKPTTARSSPSSSGGGGGGGGLFIGWTWQVWIPIVTQAFSGILVGLVTKHLGAVTKSFGNIFGIAISSLLQQLLLTDRKSGQDGLSIEELVGACLCAVSLWLHVTNPI